MLAMFHGARFGLLGPLQVLRGDGEILVPAPKHRAVLAILAINAGRPVSVERIIEELWQGVEPKFARKTLQGYVWRLRRVIGGDLLTRGGCYELRGAPQETDAARFERLLADGRGALLARDPARAHRRLGAALALWRGPALADVPASPMISAYADRLEEARLMACEAALEADVELGRHAEVIPALREFTAAHPLREFSQALLMLALYRSGRQCEALTVYGRLRALLIAEQGLEPGMAVRRLHQRILTADPGLDL
ncbi:DNA-binding SARP family transcriptional activator [Streptosporangium album]|uniref:DNA-binding SARP family transcriptional activator n=1 Tax=Streptosporangium album TaxID=47479 RepID=A0A7W7S1F3_9ACTN|nr:AfsR/SARP family transcriptional regulator [Streptosporangium album]MBB4942153.1 DNA-binding SARP family transcriptional activator [Streptosporangium album]